MSPHFVFAPLIDFHELNIDFFNCCFFKAILAFSTSAEGVTVKPINLFNSTNLLLLFLRACKSKNRVFFFKKKVEIKSDFMLFLAESNLKFKNDTLISQPGHVLAIF